MDLVMLYEQGPKGEEGRVAYTVRNNGTATATGVTVSFLLERLEVPSSRLGDITGAETVNATSQKFTWEIGTISPGGTSSNLIFRTDLHTGHNGLPPAGSRFGSIRARAFSISPEPVELQANNVIEIYSSYALALTPSDHMKGSRLGLLLSVDDLRPNAGGDVVFDLTARNFNDTSDFNFFNLIADARVKVELSKGLEFKSGWAPPGTFVKSGKPIGGLVPAEHGHV